MHTPSSSPLQRVLQYNRTLKFHNADTATDTKAQTDIDKFMWVAGFNFVVF